MQTFTVNNLDCANCAAKIEHALQQTPGIEFALLNFATGTLTVKADDVQRVHQVVGQVEPDVQLVPREDQQSDQAQAAATGLPWLEIRLGISAVFFVLGLFIEEQLAGLGWWVYLAYFAPVYLISGWTVLSGAVRKGLRGQLFDEHFLMTIATLGAWAIQEAPEAVGVMIFYNLGEALQERAVKRSRRSVQALLAVRPDYARIEQGEKLVKVDPSQAPVGSIVHIYPGERIPLDGEVIEGSSRADPSALTGESRSVNIQPGETVMAGWINLDGMLRARSTSRYQDSSMARIGYLVEQATQRKAPTERFFTQFARVYTPLMVGLAALIALVPPLVIPGASFSDWLYRALVVLVISCPCALVISIPLGYFGGVGAAASQGVLVKGSNYLDVLAQARSVVFDKTGTLTRGEFRVKRVLPADDSTGEQVLQAAVIAEGPSTHPIAESIRSALGVIEPVHTHEHQEIAGVGVSSQINGKRYLAGNDAMLHREGVAHPHCDSDGSTVFVAIDGRYIGQIEIEDTLKPQVSAALDQLRQLGIEQIGILSGDHRSAVEWVASKLGIPAGAAAAGLLPEQKLAHIEDWLVNWPRKLLYVGDGINDAPVLARADAGIAMGALGSPAAIETADVVLMSDSPDKLVEAIKISRRTRQIVWQNILMALAIKALFIGLGIAGTANLWEAVFADMGVALLALLNAMRIVRQP